MHPYAIVRLAFYGSFLQLPPQSFRVCGKSVIQRRKNWQFFLEKRHGNMIFSETNIETSNLYQQWALNRK